MQNGGQVSRAMEYPFDSYRGTRHAKENDISLQGRHPQAGGQVISADIPHGGLADALALLSQRANEPSGVGTAILGNIVANPQEVVP